MVEVESLFRWGISSMDRASFHPFAYASDSSAAFPHDLGYAAIWAVGLQDFTFAVIFSLAFTFILSLMLTLIKNQNYEKSVHHFDPPVLRTQLSESDSIST